MPTGFLKPLSKGKCLEDLKQQYDIDVGADSKRLCKAAPKLFKAAETYRQEGDEENSYILYMRYLSVIQRVSVLKKRDEIARKCFEELDKNEMKEALEYAEKLSTSLQERYKQLQQKDAATYLEKKLKEEKVEKKKVDVPAKPDSARDNINGYADISGKFITCAQLHTLLDRKKNILIMDVRSPANFSESCIKSEYVINIPETIVKSGIPTSTLEKSLPPKSKSLWNRRGSVDFVILVDWSSSSKESSPQAPISVLRNILLQWDTEVSYKRHPLILDGGYEDFLLRYPTNTTNPHPNYVPSLENLASTDYLDDIEYPTLSESPKFYQQPNIDRSSKPSSNPHNSGSSTSSVLQPKSVLPKPSVPAPSNPIAPASPKNQAPSRVATSLRPNVDRKSKAAAVLTYEERSQAVQQLLRQKEEVAEKSLQIEKNRQAMEDEWQLVCLRREKEAEEEMKKELQEREEQLMKNIIELENLQKIKDKENQALRDELEVYKKRELEDKTPKEFSVYKQEEDAITARIRISEEQRKKIMEERERKAHENQPVVQQKKPRSSESAASNPNLPDNARTYSEQERLAREKLQQDRILKQKQAIHNEKIYHESRKNISGDQEKRRQIEISNGSEGNIRNRVDNKSVPKPTERGTYTAPLKDTPSGIMKRSHSSPNIAQMDDEEMKGRPFKTDHHPELRINRQRTFSPVYGNMGRGLTGLKNLGNTCYMNSIIQCLSNTTPLARYFVSGEYRNDINRHHGTRGEIAEEVAAVVRALWSSNYKCIATRDLRSVVGKHRDQFQTNQQQDSNEFLTILMEWLHEDLKKPSPKQGIHDSGREKSAWEKQWEEFYKDNSSLIVFLFYGQQKSTVRCMRCNEESVTYETISNLTLPLPSNSNSCTLEECIQLYVKGELITGWKCPVCKEQRDAMKKLDIIKLPPILIIHFKRFYIDGWCRKRQTFVRFPLKDCDMRRYTLLPDQKYTNYDLYGVSNHYGTMEGGHYTAYCKSVEHKKWYKFDDNEVSEISSSEVQSGAAYILFYASINFQVPHVS